MSWQHITKSPELLTKLAYTTLRIRRLMLSRQIRHLEAMVRSHTKTLSKQPGGREKMDEVLQLMEKLRRELRESDG
jgi:hypothetical protein